MKALVLRDGGLSVQADYPDPKADGEAVVRPHVAGICSTDLALLHGYAGFQGVPGHEFVGTVVECGEPEWVGRRVVAEINRGCGVCGYCRRGVPGHCKARSVLGIRGRDGAMAERVRVPVANLHGVPDTVPDRAAVFVEPLAAAFQILEQVAVASDWCALILGAGRLGQLVAQVLQPRVGELWGVARSPGKRRLLASRGVSAAGSLETLPPREWDLVVECSGCPELLGAALELVRPRGTLVLKSSWVGPAPLCLSPLVVKEVHLLGSRCGPFPRALRALAAGEVCVDSLISAEYSLDDAVAAFERASQPEVLKVLIRP
ncbi:MAG: alcohol dehydrogenase catalytic domain-containing protein [Candidatus Eremiobacterota bacterium]